MIKFPPMPTLLVVWVGCFVFMMSQMGNPHFVETAISVAFASVVTIMVWSGFFKAKDTD